jgi:glycerol-3-phosphate dehydrogenase (NAD(P)+)
VAKVIAENGHDVTLWCRSETLAREINAAHTNTHYLPGVILPDAVSAMTDIEAAAEGREFLILAAPSLYLLDMVKRVLAVASIREGQTAIGVLSKGFLPGPNGPRLIIETLEDYLPGFYQHSLVYIAGPSHAEEVSRRKVSGLIAASENAKNSFRFRDLLKNNRLLVFSSLDVRGVQVAAATKNIIAIAFGLLDAMKTTVPVGQSGEGAFSGSGAPIPQSSENDFFGDGTGSLLLAAGLNEIQLLGMAMGATHAETFTSISGVGDLDVTCRSIFGRNRRFGREIIERNILRRFTDIDDLIARIAEIGYLPEGVAAAKYARSLAEQLSLKMPITTGIYRLLNQELTPKDFLGTFLGELR